MGWRADRAYEEAQREDFRTLKASLTWREYLAWQWQRHRHFLGGVATVLGALLIWRLLS